MIRDTLTFAFCQGFCERLQSEAFGRTHETNQDWNVAYDRGRYFAALAMEAAKPTRREAGSARKGDSAGPQDNAHNTSPIRE